MDQLTLAGWKMDPDCLKKKILFKMGRWFSSNNAMCDKNGRVYLIWVADNRRKMSQIFHQPKKNQRMDPPMEGLVGTCFSQRCFGVLKMTPPLRGFRFLRAGKCCWEGLWVDAWCDRLKFRLNLLVVYGRSEVDALQLTRMPKWSTGALAAVSKNGSCLPAAAPAAGTPQNCMWEIQERQWTNQLWQLFFGSSSRLLCGQRSRIMWSVIFWILCCLLLSYIHDI